MRLRAGSCSARSVQPVIVSRQHLRNLAITALVIAVVLQFALWKDPVAAQAQLTLNPPNTPVSGAPGQTGIPATLTVTNNSAIPRTVTFSQTNNTAGVTVVILSSSILLSPGSAAPVSLLVNYASTVPTGSTLGTAIITASSSDTPSASASAQLTFTTTGASPTPTLTATGTSTAVPTVSPT